MTTGTVTLVKSKSEVWLPTHHFSLIIFHLLRIGIEGHNLEQPRWGMGHTISNVLKEFGRNPELSKDLEFYLYFHSHIPDFDFLKHPKIKLRLIKPPLFKNLTALNIFYHILLPFAAKKDKIDLMYYPSYLMPMILLIPGFKKNFNG